jgi:SAM-dependent methyltransferase
MTPEEYWRSNAKLEHITPPGERYPEIGLFNALQKAVIGSVFEFGCGDGRLSPAFDPELYTGFDINQSALESARRANPKHAYSSEWVEADTVLAYTVLLHIPDHEIEPLIERIKSYKRIVIGEIMGRQWRRPGNPPVFNRDIEEYVEMLGRPYEVIAVPYPRYGCDLELIVC